MAKKKDDKAKEKYLLKKQIHHLKNLKGSGTELISVYIPSKAQIHATSNKLKEEAGQASNIKSKGTRKNVMDALEKIIHHLKSYGHIAPESGIAIFCGNVSDNPSKTDIQLFAIFPPEPMKVQTYRCDSRFYLGPLEEMVEVKESYGLVVMDGRECTIATLRGTNVKILKRLHSTAHSKIRKGGQCLAPDTMVFAADGGLLPVSEVKIGTDIKGADLSEFKISNWNCEDKFYTKAKQAYKIIVHAPKMEIVATAWHRFFTITPAGVKEIYAKDLKIGDRVLIAKKIWHDGADVKINYKPELAVGLDKKEFKKLRQRRIELELSQSMAAKKLNISQMAVCRMERGEIPLGLKKTREMYELYGLKLDGKKYIKPKLKLPEAYGKTLAYLLGVIAGDGSLDGNRICIYESYPQLVEKYMKASVEAIEVEPKCYVVDKRGQKGSFAKKEYYEIRIYSKEFAGFVKKEVPQIIASADTRCVPEQILKSKTEVQAAFLSGLYDAEGYMNGKRVDMAMRARKMLHQIQAMLLRLGIQASFGEKKVQGNPQWFVSISDRQSVRKFMEKIGFSRKDKKKALANVAKQKTMRQYTNQVPVDGREVFAFAKSLELKTSDFHAASCFFRNVKPLGYEAFGRNIAGVIRKRAKEVGVGEKADKLLCKWTSQDIGIATVAQKIPIKEESEYIDLTIPNAFNFVANGFIVHNSARRFQRLIEESIEFYYKRIGGAMDRYFVNTVKGVIVGGPGPAKQDFKKMSPFNYQIKVLGVVDTGYTDEHGLKEMMAKANEIIVGQQAIKEKEIIDKFIKAVVSNGLAAYGEANVREALEKRQASTLLISEGLEWKRYHLKIDGEEKWVNKRSGEKIPKHDEKGRRIEILSEHDLRDDLIELADGAGAEVEIISTETSEGAQFFQSFYGIGAFLRYK
ncbi:MAG: LAGLIDADG family homing endonuclease [Candidatus Micrarchaeota archaeon]